MVPRPDCKLLRIFLSQYTSAILEKSFFKFLSSSNRWLRWNVRNCRLLSFSAISPSLIFYGNSCDPLFEAVRMCRHNRRSTFPREKKFPLSTGSSRKGWLSFQTDENDRHGHDAQAVERLRAKIVDQGPAEGSPCSGASQPGQHTLHIAFPPLKRSQPRSVTPKCCQILPDPPSMPDLSPSLI